MVLCSFLHFMKLRSWCWGETHTRRPAWKAVHLGLVGDALEGPCVGGLVGFCGDLSRHLDGE